MGLGAGTSISLLQGQEWFNWVGAPFQLEKLFSTSNGLGLLYTLKAVKIRGLSLNYVRALSTNQIM